MIQNKTVSAKELPKLISQNIDINSLVQIMQQGSKEAMNTVIVAMSNASKQGITDLSQLKESMKLINASVSSAAQENPSQILKSFMLLYLPWLPLQEGVDFELEVEGSKGGESESESSIIILISTKQYGNVKITLVLSGSNNISIIINCSENFPEKELLNKLNAESKRHSIQSDVAFEKNITQPSSDGQGVSAQAKISLSNLTEVNPFLLLMANAVIRYTIELDNLAC